MTQGYAAEVAEHVQVDAAGHPDGTTKWQRVASPTDRSTRFLSFADWNDAHDSAYLTLEKQFKSAGADRAHGPIVGPTGEPFAMASGYIEFLDIDDPGSVIVRPLGEGYAGVKDGTERTARFRRPDGSELEAVVYPTTARTPREDIRYVYATMGWTGSEWVLINLYPAARPRPTTEIGLKKRPVESGGSKQPTIGEH